jgi:YtoQ family protein
MKVYLSGEIHSDWREQIVQGVREHQLPVEILGPVTTHDASDNVGVEILGPEADNFWQDHKAAKINSIRIRYGIDQADIVVVKFGEQYRQWNAAFDAGYAAAKGKALIVIHPPDFTHALKEVDAAAMAVAENATQVVEILRYVTLQP